MKLRARSLALLLSASFAALASVPLLPSTAYAQDDAVLKMARERFQEGVKYYDHHKYDDARAAFLQAYALKKHPAVLLNLAQSELHSGHEADAAKHFAKFLRDAKESSASEKMDAQKGLAAAKAKVAEITVTVNQPNAEVFVDNKSEGKAPLDGPVYLKPGNHTIEARKGGKAGTVNVNAAAGMTNSVNITIGAPPTTMPAAGGPPPAGAAPPMGGGAPTEPTGLATPPPATGGPDQGAQAGGGFKMDTGGSRQPFLPWVAHNKVAWVGGGLTVVGLGVGIGFAIASRGAYNAADSVAGQIVAVASQRGDNPRGLCSSTNPSLRQVYGQACQQYQDNVNTGDTDKTVSVVGFVVGGVAAAGTIVYYFVDSKNKPAEGATADGVHAAFVPYVSPHVGGLGVVGTF